MVSWPRSGYSKINHKGSARQAADTWLRRRGHRALPRPSWCHRAGLARSRLSLSTCRTISFSPRLSPFSFAATLWSLSPSSKATTNTASCPQTRSTRATTAIPCMSSIPGRLTEPATTAPDDAGDLLAAREASPRPVQICTLLPAPLPTLLFAAAGKCHANHAGRQNEERSHAIGKFMKREDIEKIREVVSCAAGYCQVV